MAHYIIARNLVVVLSSPWLTFTDPSNDELRAAALGQKEALQVLAHAAVLHPIDKLTDDRADVPGVGIEGVNLVQHFTDEVAPGHVCAFVKLGAGGGALHGIVRVAGPGLLPEAPLRRQAVAGAFVSSDAIGRVLSALSPGDIPDAPGISETDARGLVDTGLEPIGEPAVVVAVLAEVGTEGVNVCAGAGGGGKGAEIVGRCSSLRSGEDRAD